MEEGWRPRWWKDRGRLVLVRAETCQENHARIKNHCRYETRVGERRPPAQAERKSGDLKREQVTGGFGQRSSKCKGPGGRNKPAQLSGVPSTSSWKSSLVFLPG